MEAPIRVLQLIKGLGRGGAEMLLLELERTIDRDRYRLAHGYFLPWKDALVGPLEAAGGEVVRFPARHPLGMLLAVPRVAAFLRRWRADLVHAHLPLSGVVARLAGRLCGVPVIYTEHNLMERYHPWTRRLNLLTWGLQSRVLAVSNEVAASIGRHAGGRVPVDVLLNGVACDRFRPDPPAGRELRHRLGIPGDAPVIGTVAVLRPQKRLEDWLEAARQVHARQPQARFLIVGDGALRRRLEALVAELGLTEAVHMVGLQEEVRPYLAAMDVYLMSSVFEGLPIALLEAMAMELPAVVTAVGGVAEVVREGVSGRLVPPGEPRRLASAALELLGDAALRARLGRAARERVETRFSLRRMTSELEAIYAGELAR